MRLSVLGPEASATLAQARLREMIGAFGTFSVPRLASFHAGLHRQEKFFSETTRKHSFLLSAEEAGTGPAILTR